ncbi:MAG: T9SS type A sorting domain-containing protein [Chitinophagaceae bacterium]
MKKIILLIAIFLSLQQAIIINAQTVQTIVGTSTSASYPALGAGANGDGIGTSINIQPGSGAICSDGANNIYFVDRHGKYIRKWNAITRQVTTIAGNGNANPPNAYASINTGTLPGDGGLATNLNIAATSICVTVDGNYLYFAEGFYETLRVINLTTGIVNVVCGYNAGASNSTYCSDEVVNDHRIARYARISTTAQHSLTIDENNNLYVADGISSRRIRKIFRNPVTNIADGNSAISTLAFGSGGISSATDGISGYASIPKASGSGACLQPSGYGYLGTNSGGVDLVYRNNYLYFTELSSAGSTTTLRFRKMNLTTLQITTIHNEVTTTGTPSVNISGFAMDNLNNMYVTDLFHSRIYKVTQAGIFTTFVNRNYVNSSSYPPYAAGTGIGGLYPQFSSGSGITNDAYGNLIYVDGGNYSINKITICNTPDAITGANNVCVGNSITLSNTTAGGTWSSIIGRATINSSGVVTGGSAGVAQLRYTLPFAATATCSNYTNYYVTVNPIPFVPTITYAPGTPNPQLGAPRGGFCVGRVFTVVGTPNIPAGTWSATGFASITSGGVVTINNVGAGSIKYTYTSAAGCSNSRTMVGNGFVCAARGAIDNKQLASGGEFTMYPNPAKSVVSLQVEKLIGSGKLLIIDYLGKVVKEQPLSMGTNTVNISNLSKGMYFVSTITSEGKTTKKLVVE